MWDNLIQTIKDAGGSVEKFTGDLLNMLGKTFLTEQGMIDAGMVTLTPEEQALAEKKIKTNYEHLWNVPGDPSTDQPTVQTVKKTSTRAPAKPKPVIIKWSISKWAVKNGTWTTQPILTVNGQTFSYPTPQGYIDKFIALKGIRAYVRFNTNITKFQAALKVWGNATPVTSAATQTPGVSNMPGTQTPTQTTPQVMQEKKISKIENPPWRTSGDSWTTPAVLTIYYNAPYPIETFRGTTPADYIAKLQSIRSLYYATATVDRWIQEFQQGQNYWNLEILNRQLANQLEQEEMQNTNMPGTQTPGVSSTTPAQPAPQTAVQFTPNAYPKTVTVGDATLRVRSAPYTTAALAGSQYLYSDDQFIVTGYVTGENVEGENRWWTSQFGNYVWVGGTIQKP